METTIDLARWARESRTAAISDVEVLAAVSLSKAGRETYVNMVSDEQFHNDYRGAILRRAGEAGVIDRPVFEQLAVNQDALDYDTAKALKKALFLGDWIEEVRTKDIERRYQVWAGALRRVGEEYAWLVEALAAVAQACGWPEARSVEEPRGFRSVLCTGSGRMPWRWSACASGALGAPSCDD